MTWESAVATLIFSIVGYLIGSISFSVLISKKFMKEDIRTKSSGNAGATNTLRNYGPKIAIIVLVLDMLKPIIAIVIAYVSSLFMKGDWTLIIFQAVGYFAIIGHIFPIFFGFRGGKGAASYAGYLLVIYWPLFILGFFVWVSIVVFTKKVSLSSILTPVILLVIQIVFSVIPHMNESWGHIIPLGTEWWVTSMFLTLLASIIIYKHKENIKRLMSGTENKIGKKNK